MGSGVARALREAIKKPAQPRPAPRDSVLGNPQRRRVIQYLCIHPCGSLSEGGRALGISPATVRFHALRLAEAGYLVESMHGFYPQGFVDPDDLPMFETLGAAASRAVLATVYARPGLPLTDLARETNMTRQAASSLLDAFESQRLVTRVADGKYVRVYPTQALEERRSRHRPRARQFVDEILRRMTLEGESPEVLRRTSTGCMIRFGRGPSKALLELALEPHAHALR